MKPIANFENVVEAGERQVLPAGGYVCVIRSAKVQPNKSGNGEHLEIMLDVAKGEYKGFFEADYRAQDREDKYWHGIYNQNIPNEESPKYDFQCRFFKRFTNAVEASNDGYHWAWAEDTLKGKLIGVVFRQEEKISSAGNQYIKVIADSVYSVEKIEQGKYTVPELKRLETAPAAAEPEYKDLPDLPF